MPAHRIETMTHCTRRGHDLSLPGAIYRNRRTGHASCNACRQVNSGSTKALYRDYHRIEVEAAENKRALQIMRLVDELERCSTHWEREEVRQRMRRLQEVRT